MNMAETVWPGSRWWRVDFHTHTPASEDYGKRRHEPVTKAPTPRKWLLDYMDAGIDCVAITDHNSGAWIDKLREALKQLKEEKPAGYRPLTLFPGVELSVSGGVHILAIFDSSKTTSHVDSLLGAVGYGGRKGDCDGVTSKSLVDVVEAIDKAGGLAIPAHVNGPKGVFQEVHGQTLRLLLDTTTIVAMEVVDDSKSLSGLYCAKEIAWTHVLGSDSHHPSGEDRPRLLGSRYTWVKMGTPSLDGLRLALLDGAQSVKRSPDTSTDPNAHATEMIESIEVRDAVFLGRGQKFNLSFSPWLTTIVGGRGTGKSTSIEFLRLALRRKDELPSALEADLAKYAAVRRTRNDDGLLTDKTHLTVVYRKNGACFRVQWSQDGSAPAIQRETPDGGWEGAEGEVKSRFPVRIFSQKQVYQLAKEPGALLRVIDEAPEVGRRDWERRWQEEEARFLSLRAKARELEVGLAEESRLKGELDDIQRKLAVFESSGHAEILKSYQRRHREKRQVDAWEADWRELGKRIRDLAAETVPDALRDSLSGGDGAGIEALLTAADDTHKELEAIQKELDRLGARADKVVRSWASARSGSDWARDVRDSLEAFEKLKQALAEQGVGDPAAYGRLVQDRQAAEQRLRGLSEQRDKVGVLEKQAQASLARLLDLRRALSRRRADFLSEVLKDNPHVRIEVVPYGARGTIESEFRAIIGKNGPTFAKDIGSPDDGEGLLAGICSVGAEAETVEAGLETLKRKVQKIASDAPDAPKVSYKQFAAHLRRLQPEALDRLDVWFPGDSLIVTYSPKGDGNVFRSIQDGSPGQKTAALLAFLLSYGHEPLVLDQPEDDLDNHLIYGLIVAQLRAIKSKRQLIIVTHNPNIVVNGDAELVVALRVANGRTQEEARGSLQNSQVRETICDVMEGGREAFKRRFRRIMLERRHGE